MREVQAIEFKLSKLILLSLLCQIGFGLPIITLLMAISVLDFEAGLFFLGISLGLVAPILGFFSWLIAKGSNGTSIEPALKLVFVLPGRFYGAFLGGLIGWHFAHQLGGIIGAILFFFVGGYFGMFIGARFGGRFFLSGMNS